jgi:hypothetical protein
VKVLYDFAGQPGEMSLAKGEILELVEKDKDGKLNNQFQQV